MNARSAAVNPRVQPRRRAGAPLALLALALWAAPAAAEDDPAAPAAPDLKLAEPSREAELRPAAGEVEEVCERIGGKLASVTVGECLERSLEPSGARSVEGAPILLREFPPLPGRRPLGRVLLFGGIHGDEYSSVTIVFKWMSILDRHHSGLFHWRIIPLLNPDGLLRERSQRMNHRGVDLNRNFPTPDWVAETADYWIRRTGRNPRRYPGPSPLSEPESQWLVDEIERFRPAAIVAVHAPSHVVDYDGPPEPPEKLGPLYLQQIGTYPGSLGRFAGEQLGLPVVTIELPSAGIMPTPADQSKIWTDLVAWLRKHIGDHPERVEWVASISSAEEGGTVAADAVADGDGAGEEPSGPLPACLPTGHPILPYAQARCW